MPDIIAPKPIEYLVNLSLHLYMSVLCLVLYILREQWRVRDFTRPPLSLPSVLRLRFPSQTVYYVRTLSVCQRVRVCVSMYVTQ